MKISEHSIISNEWLDSEILRLTSLYSEDTHRIGSKIEALLEVKKQLLSPMPLCDKVFEVGGDISEDYVNSNSETTWNELKNNYLNSDITL